jgi:hypothetical protein
MVGRAGVGQQARELAGIQDVSEHESNRLVGQLLSDEQVVVAAAQIVVDDDVANISSPRAR